MLQNAYFLAKIGADTAENEQHFAEILPIGRRVAERTSAPADRSASPRGSAGGRTSAAIPACGRPYYHWRDLEHTLFQTDFHKMCRNMCSKLFFMVIRFSFSAIFQEAIKKSIAKQNCTSSRSSSRGAVAIPIMHREPVRS